MAWKGSGIEWGCEWGGGKLYERALSGVEGNRVEEIKIKLKQLEWNGVEWINREQSGRE